MKFTINWLKKHLKTSASYSEIAEELTNIGLEVEDVVNFEKLYSDFVIAKIESFDKHPNADKLNVCIVNDGKQALQIVCGAPNVEKGMIVVLAPIGTKMPQGDFVIKEAKIRGVKSYGMLCSAAELNLGADFDGIMKLSDSAKVGSKFIDYYGLNDVVYDISITPNRGDCLSVYGIARDLSATKIGRLIACNENYSNPSNSELPFEVLLKDKVGCQSISFVYVKNVRNNFESPKEIKNPLKLVDVNSNGPLVDISNFAMYEYGRPNHVYDADKIKGDIEIRQSKLEEPFIPIGGTEILLPQGITVIADEEKVLAIAGVIGGELSKVDEHTKNILLEVANFNPSLVRRAGTKLNIITDSRFRFERRIDYGNTEFFIDNILGMISKYCGGEIIGFKNFQGQSIDYIKEIEVDFNKVEKVLGISLDQNKYKEILNSLGFIFSNDKLLIPSWRYGDVENIIDISEEIIRIYGINKVGAKSIPLDYDSISLPGGVMENQLSDLLVQRGMDEVITWSFISRELSSYFSSEKHKVVILDNPISKEREVMKPNGISSILEIIAKNIARGFKNSALFEICNIYDEKYFEMQKKCVVGVRCGNAKEKSVHDEERKYDFYDVKDDVFALISNLGYLLDDVKIDRETPSYYHPSRSAAFYIGQRLIGYAGEIHPEILKKVDINSNLVSFELFVDDLLEIKTKEKGKFEKSDFQMVNRDFAFIVDENISVGNIISTIKDIDSKLIQDVRVFDIFKGKEIGEGKKSVAINVRLQPKTQTLSEEEIEKISNLVISRVESKVGGTLRG